MAKVNTNRIYGKQNTAQKKPAASSSVSIQSQKAQSPATAAAVPAKKRTGEKIITKRVPAKNKTFPAVLVIFALLCTSMVMLMVFNYAKRYEASVTVSDQERQLAKLQTELSMLEAQKESAISSADLQNYSTQELGYVHQDQLPYRVVSVEREDRIITSEAEEEKGGLEMLLSTIRSLFE